MRTWTDEDLRQLEVAGMNLQRVWCSACSPPRLTRFGRPPTLESPDTRECLHLWWGPWSSKPVGGSQNAEGDFAKQMVDGMHKYLDRELAASVAKRKQHWKTDYSSPEAYTKSVEPNRERLKKIIGVVDPRVPNVELEYVATTNQSALV